MFDCWRRGGRVRERGARAPVCVCVCVGRTRERGGGTGGGCRRGHPPDRWLRPSRSLPKTKEMKGRSEGQIRREIAAIPPAGSPAQRVGSTSGALRGPLLSRTLGACSKGERKARGARFLLRRSEDSSHTLFFQSPRNAQSSQTHRTTAWQGRRDVQGQGGTQGTRGRRSHATSFLPGAFFVALARLLPQTPN